MQFIISGYGVKPQTGAALYEFHKGQPLKIKWQEKDLLAPSYVCRGDGCLFTITEAEEYACVYIYQQDGEGYRLTDKRILEGGSLCHITYSQKNKALFGACYETGTLFSIRVNEGHFGELLYHEEQTGDDPAVVTRAHCVLLNGEEDTLYVTNIALDRLFVYSLTDGRPSLIREKKLPAGSGPRHAILSRDEKYLYIITEYSNEIFVVKNDVSMELIQSISTLTEGFTGVSNCSTLCLSKNGAYLYAANRGADTIALFDADNDSGKLKIKGEFGCGGKHPRHMVLLEDGSYLIVCNQFSDSVVIHELSRGTGEIVKTEAVIEFYQPSGITEVK